MKLGQLIEHNIRNIFLQKSYTICVGKTSPKPFSKKIKIEHISRSTVWNFIQFTFIVCQVKPYQNIMKTICFCLIKSLLKTKQDLGLVAMSYFQHDFSIEIFFALYFLNWQNFIVWLSLLLEILGNICINIICFTVYYVINFEINLNFFVKPFSYMTKKVRTKIEIS